MVDVKEAIARAKDYAQELLGETDLLLEEVHSRPDRFEITLSFPKRGLPQLNPLVARASGTREYKIFEVNRSNGEILGMSIRQIA